MLKRWRRASAVIVTAVTAAVGSTSNMATSFGTMYETSSLGDADAGRAASAPASMFRRSSYLCSTSYSPVSTAPCAPSVPRLLDPACCVEEIFDVCSGSKSPSSLPADRHFLEPISSQASTQAEPMPDTDDEFDEPFWTPMQCAVSAPFPLVPPFMLGEQIPIFVTHAGPACVQQQYCPLQQFVGAGVPHAEHSSSDVPPFAQTDVHEDGDVFADVDDETDTDFFQSISFSEFMAAYNPAELEPRVLERSASESLALSFASARQATLCRSAFMAWAAACSRVTCDGNSESNSESEEA